MDGRSIIVPGSPFANTRYGLQKNSIPPILSGLKMMLTEEKYISPKWTDNIGVADLTVPSVSGATAPLKTTSTVLNGKGVLSFSSSSVESGNALAANISDTPNFTIHLVYVNSSAVNVTGTRVILDIKAITNNAFQLVASNSGSTLGFIIDNGTRVNTTIAAPNSTKMIISISYSRATGELKFYQNGVLKDTFTSVNIKLSGYLMLGRRIDTMPVAWYSGVIAYFSLYSRVLAPAEILTIYNHLNLRF